MLLVCLAFLFVPVCSCAENEQLEKELEKGMSLFGHEYYEEALAEFKAVWEKNKQSSLVAYYLGMTYKKLQNYRQAKPFLEAAVVLTPKIKGALIELIDLLYRIDELHEAKKWIEVAQTEGIIPAQAAFFDGLTLLREGKTEEGIIALKKAKEIDESLSQIVDYQVGMAYIRENKFKEARLNFTQLATQDPTTDLAIFANQYLDTIEKMERQLRPFKFSIGTALQYDDNVILLPDDESLVTDPGKEHDARYTVNFNGEYNYRPTKETEIKAAYYLYFADQFELNFYDTMNNIFLLQPSFYAEKVSISFPATYNHIFVDDRSYMNSASIGNMDNILLPNNQMLQIAPTYRYNKYLWAPSAQEENRDASQYQSWLAWYKFFANNKGFFSLKYTANYDDAKGRNWQMFGNKGTIAVLIPMFDKVKLNLIGDMYLQNFKNEHTVFLMKREDKTFLLSSLLAIEIMKDLELQLQYTRVDNDSNIGLYKYTRNIYSAGLEYRF